MNWGPGRNSLPAFIVVTCDNVQQLDALLPLVEHMPKSIPVYVCPDLGAPQAFVTHWMKQLAGSVGKASNFELSLDTCSQLNNESELAQPQLLLLDELVPQIEQSRLHSERKQYHSGELQSQGHWPQLQDSPCYQRQPSPALSQSSDEWTWSPLTSLPVAQARQGEQPDMAVVSQLSTSTPTPMTPFCLQAGFSVDAATMQSISPLYSFVQLQSTASPNFAMHADSPVDHILGPIRACSNTELDKMLRAAMPEYYDD